MMANNETKSRRNSIAVQLPENSRFTKGIRGIRFRVTVMNPEDHSARLGWLVPDFVCNDKGHLCIRCDGDSYIQTIPCRNVVLIGTKEMEPDSEGDANLPVPENCRKTSIIRGAQYRIGHAYKVHPTENYRCRYGWLMTDYICMDLHRALICYDGNPVIIDVKVSDLVILEATDKGNAPGQKSD